MPKRVAARQKPYATPMANLGKAKLLCDKNMVGDERLELPTSSV